VFVIIVTYYNIFQSSVARVLLGLTVAENEEEINSGGDASPLATVQLSYQFRLIRQGNTLNNLHIRNLFK
jgi:hypothetical protein